MIFLIFETLEDQLTAQLTHCTLVLMMTGFSQQWDLKYPKMLHSDFNPANQRAPDILYELRLMWNVITAAYNKKYVIFNSLKTSTFFQIFFGKHVGDGNASSEWICMCANVYIM